MVSHTDATLVVMPSGFGEQAGREKVIKHPVDVCPRFPGFCDKVLRGGFTTGTECV
jgi:hypothetical protein